MIAVPRLWAMLAGLALGLVMVPMAFAYSTVSLGEPLSVAPFVLAVELLLYFILALFASPRATLGSAFLVTFIFTSMRALASVVGAGLAQMLPNDGPPDAILNMWVGHPIVIALQVGLILMLGSHVMAALMPEVVGEDFVARLRSSSENAPATKTPATAPVVQASPTGGFVQVFSFDELTATIRKVQGLEGFILYNEEGLIVWRDLPMRIEADAVVAKVLSLNNQYAGLMEASGLTRVRRVMVESREHFLFSTPLNQTFGLILLFNSRVPSEDILSKVGYVSKTAREFLQWKYPALPITTGLSTDRNPMPVG